ncbi:MAG: HlyC/CorC family transporter [Anaerolineae bacterium]|nr:HlyC/CorC family transporter [Anaerolineae bacterium]
MSSYHGLWALILLVLQAFLVFVRTILTYSRWEFEEMPTPQIAERPALSPFSDITRLSVAVDFPLLLTTGFYFNLGIDAVAPRIAAYLSTAFGQTLAWIVPISQITAVLLLGWVSLTLGYLFPEALGSALASRWHQRSANLARGLHLLLQPFTLSALALANSLSHRISGAKLQRTALITEEEIKTLVTAGEQEGLIEEEARAMIYSIFRLDDMITREVMLPRIDIVALDVDSSSEQILDVVTHSGHSRIPVYAETIDNIIGILYVKDLLPFYATQREPLILREILRPAHFVPEFKRLDTLLKELQAEKVQLAIVVDEYGGVAGLVTLEDLVEEIVGEIQDEYDHEEPEMTRDADGAYLFDARIPLDDVQELLNIPLPLEEADSLGGFVYNELGHIPAVGETLEYGPVAFSVVATDGRRIRKVRAIQAPASTEIAKEPEAT